MSNDDSRPSLIELQFNSAKEICKPDAPVRPSHSVPLAGTVKNAGVVDEDKNPRSTPPAAKARAQVAPKVGQPVVGHGAGGLKPKEFKPFRITVRFAESEREILVRQAEKSCLTVSEYIRASVLGASYLSAIDPVKRELLKNISRELGHQGNNLNQIAKHLNTGNVPIDEGNSMLAILARSLLPAHQAVRRALAEGKVMP